MALVTTSIQTNQVFMILLALTVVVLATCVAFVYIVRIAITVVLVAAAPLALAFLAFPFTEGLARLWWRALAGMLAIQVCQSLVFVTALQILFSDNPANSTTSAQPIPTNGPDAMDLLTIICLMWVLLRIPSWVARTVWQQARPRTIGNLIRTFLVYRGVGTVLSKVTTGTNAKSPMPSPRRGGGPNGPGPGGRGRGGGPTPRGPRGGPGRPGSGTSAKTGPNGSTGSTGTPAGNPNGPSGNSPRPHTNSSQHSRRSTSMPTPRRPSEPKNGTGGAYLPSHGGLPDSRPSQPTPQAPRPQPPRRTAPRGPRDIVTLRIDPPPRRPTKPGSSATRKGVT
jgi:hypothetical protein